MRHGETAANKEGRLQGHGNEPLNEGGKVQARIVGEKLKSEKIDFIISSDLRRASETAEIIGAVTGAEVVHDVGMRDRNHGEAEGMLRGDALLKYGNLYSYDARVGGGESYREVEERIWPIFEKHRKRNGDKNVLIVTHGGVLRMLIKKLRNLSIEEAMIRGSIKNGEILSFSAGLPCEKCGSHFFEQDSDTLDTWF